MKLRQIFAWVLAAAMLLAACGGPEVPQAPSDAVVQNDIADYITEILDSSAAIIAFSRGEDEQNASRVNIECEVTYRGDQGEYTGIFTLEYHFNKNEWVLERCSLELTERPEEPKEEPTGTAPDEDTTDSTGNCALPIASDSVPEDTEQPGTEAKDHWKINYSKMTIYVGESFNLRVTNEADKTASVKWKAKKSGIVSISGNRITGKAKGETTITGIVDGQSFSCVVVVKEKAASTPVPTTSAPYTPPETTKPTEPSSPSEITKPTEPAPPPETTKPTEPSSPPETTKPTEPAPPPETTKPTEPQGKAPTGYSIRLSPSEVILYQPFYVTVNPDVDDYTKIVIHAVDPKGGVWDFVISSGNSYDLLVDRSELTGTWTIYADVYNAYGVFKGASSGARAYLKVNPLPF